MRCLIRSSYGGGPCSTQGQALLLVRDVFGRLIALVRSMENLIVLGVFLPPRERSQSDSSHLLHTFEMPIVPGRRHIKE